MGNARRGSAVDLRAERCSGRGRGRAAAPLVGDGGREGGRERAGVPGRETWGRDHDSGPVG